jgi:hypothetical protein
MDLTDKVKGQRQYFLRFGAGARQLAGTGLSMTTVCQANAAILPRLKDGGSTVHFEASQQAVVSAGPTVEHAKAHVIAGAFGTPTVTMQVFMPRRAPTVAAFAAAHMASGNPPQPEVKYHIDYSGDFGKTWRPLVQDWTIPRRGDEPKDFWSQSFCHGGGDLVDEWASVQVRFHNSGGKPIRRAEVHVVHRAITHDATKVTFDWIDDGGAHRESNVFARLRPVDWILKTGRNVQTRWVEFEPVATR